MKKRPRIFPKPPPAKAIAAARLRYGLNQEEAAALIYYTLNGWQRLEYGDRALQPALWEYWQQRAALWARSSAAVKRRLTNATA